MAISEAAPDRSAHTLSRRTRRRIARRARHQFRAELAICLVGCLWLAVRALS